MSNANDLIYFVHVPKAAGSTINHHLAGSLGVGYSHCESFINDENLLKARISEANWMSGHVTFDRVKKLLGWATERRIKYYSCMREPKAQIMSGLNWLIEIGCRDNEFLYRHPQNVVDLHFELRAAKLDNKYNLMHILTKHRAAFFNAQPKWILGEEISNAPHDKIIRILSEYKYIGNISNIDELITRMGMDVIDESLKNTYINRVAYHFDVSLFEDEDVNFLIHQENRQSYILYDLVSTHFSPQEIAKAGD